jgi:hypothetical protein
MDPESPGPSYRIFKDGSSFRLIFTERRSWKKSLLSKDIEKNPNAEPSKEQKKGCFRNGTDQKEVESD